MARKKLTPQSQSQPASPKAAAVANGGSGKAAFLKGLPRAPAEVMENLKTLNGVLVKQTAEARQQNAFLRSQLEEMSLDQAFLSSLEHSVSRVVLSSQLADGRDRLVNAADGKVRSVEAAAMREVASCKAELAGLEDDVSKLEKRLVMAATEKENVRRGLEEEKRAGVERAREEKREVERVLNGVLVERDACRRELGVEREERKGLEREMKRLEVRVGESEQALRRAREEYEAIAEESRCKGEACRALALEKEAVEKKLEDATRLAEETRREMALAVRAKEEDMVVVRAELVGKLSFAEEACRSLRESETKLLADVSRLEEEVGLFRDEERLMSLKVSELERVNGELREELHSMAAELEVETEEKREKVRAIEVLEEASRQEVGDLRSALESMAGDKAEVERLKAELEAQVREMQSELGKLGCAILRLQVAGRHHAEENRALKADKGALQTSLDQETKETKTLRQKVKELLRSKESLEKELGKLRASHDAILREKEGKESDLWALMEEKASIEKSLTEARTGLDDAEKKLRAARSLSDRVLAMLRSTVQAIYGRDGGRDVELRKASEDEVEPFARELESVRKVFRSRGEEAEAMRGELRAMQESVADAKKKRGFWALMSYATTAIAALSVAYVAKSG